MNMYISAIYSHIYYLFIQMCGPLVHPKGVIHPIESRMQIINKLSGRERHYDKCSYKSFIGNSPGLGLRSFYILYISREDIHPQLAIALRHYKPISKHFGKENTVES
jgi:hypothetical protein